jgi:uncharacterized protein (TIGR03083 family)
MDDRVFPLAQYLDNLAAASAGMASVAADGPLDAMTRTCPEWNLRDLVHHQGEVHRFATAVVSGGCRSPRDVPDGYLGALPDDADLVAWFQAGAAALADALCTAGDGELMTFHPNSDVRPSRRWWARRQANETLIHHVDACSAVGPLPVVAAALAHDGIDEFLTGFLPRPRTVLHTDTARRLRVSTEGDDVERSWTVTLSPGEPVTVRDDEGPVDAHLVGAASDVLLALWNRGGLETLAIDGDAGLVHLVRDHVRIRWS